MADWKTPFLLKLAECGNVTRACKKAKVSRVMAYRVRRDDEDFRAAWSEAAEIAVGLLEDEAWRRAREGTVETEFYKGKKIGTVRKYSDTLLIFLLKAHNPAVYNPPTRAEVSGKDGGAIEVKTTVDSRGFNDSLLRLAEALGTIVSGEGAGGDSPVGPAE